ncbi:hypothetical protein FZC68_17540 [Bacillus pumilus]|uniref:Uncharacterized protein n=1 Tax=Bacillus pumilus TaxID=1408 RepID=A0AAD0HP67_BACPU|nr:hypothetical protein C5695_13320 [Bacillus pumilus]TYS40316.1 hypothetical protein FZC68_17540 [Bacillus pumilus]
MLTYRGLQRVDKPSHSLSGLRSFARPSLDFKGFHVALKRRRRAKTNIILALCQQSVARLLTCRGLFLFLAF